MPRLGCTSLGIEAGQELKRTILRTGRLTLGVLLVLAGVVAGFLPIVQGWVFILAGLTIMAPESHRARKLLEWAKEKAGIKSSKADGDEAGPDGCSGERATSKPAPPGDRRPVERGRL